MSSPT
ncbi:hypothetical protein EYF80_067635 [Liparis tanakae]